MFELLYIKNTFKHKKFENLKLGLLHIECTKNELLKKKKSGLNKITHKKMVFTHKINILKGLLALFITTKIFFLASVFIFV